MLWEGFEADVGVPDRGGSFQTHSQQDNGKYDGRAYLFAVEPVVMFAIDKYEYDAYQP